MNIIVLISVLNAEATDSSEVFFFSFFYKILSLFDKFFSKSLMIYNDTVDDILIICSVIVAVQIFYSCFNNQGVNKNKNRNLMPAILIE